MSKQSFWFKLAYFFTEEKNTLSSVSSFEFFARCVFTILVFPFWAVIHFGLLLPLLYSAGFLMGYRPIVKRNWLYEWVRIFRVRPIYLLTPAVICYLALVNMKVIGAPGIVFKLSLFFVFFIKSLALLLGFCVFVVTGLLVVFFILALIRVCFRELFSFLFQKIKAIGTIHFD